MENSPRIYAKLFNFRKPAFLLEKEKKGAPIQWIASSDPATFKFVVKNAPEKKFNNGVNTFFIEGSYPTAPADGLYVIEVFTNKARDGKTFNNVRVVEGPLDQKNMDLITSNLVTEKVLAPIEAPKRTEKRRDRDDSTEASDPDQMSDSENSSEEDLFAVDLSQNFKQVIRLLEKQQQYHAKLQKVSKNLVAEMKYLEQQLARVSLRKI